MPRPQAIIRPMLVFALAGMAALASSGCGTSTANVERGRALFVAKCGACHVMAEAATTGVVGPNLDDAFAAARAAGMDSDTVEGIVAVQVEFPRPATDNPAVSMPAGLVEGQDLKDVAAYVAKYAGVPGSEPPAVPGEPGAQVFANNGCGGCHILAAAGSGGTTGPNLDEVLPGQTAQMIEQSVVDPNTVLTQGFGPDIMPTNFAATISPADLKLLVDFLLESVGAGAGGGGGQPGG